MLERKFESRNSATVLAIRDRTKLTLANHQTGRTEARSSGGTRRGDASV